MRRMRRGIVRSFIFAIAVMSTCRRLCILMRFIGSLHRRLFFAAYTEEQLSQDLAQLESWGNLTAQQEATRARNIAEFKRKKFRYQCTPYTVEIERMVERLRGGWGIHSAVRWRRRSSTGCSRIFRRCCSRPRGRRMRSCCRRGRISCIIFARLWRMRRIILRICRCCTRRCAARCSLGWIAVCRSRGARWRSRTGRACGSSWDRHLRASVCIRRTGTSGCRRVSHYA